MRTGAALDGRVAPAPLRYRGHDTAALAPGADGGTRGMGV